MDLKLHRLPRALHSYTGKRSSSSSNATCNCNSYELNVIGEGCKRGGLHFSEEIESEECSEAGLEIASGSNKRVTCLGIAYLVISYRLLTFHPFPIQPAGEMHVREQQMVF